MTLRSSESSQKHQLVSARVDNRPQHRAPLHKLEKNQPLQQKLMPDELRSGGRGPNLLLALGHIRQIEDTEKVRAQSSNIPRQPNAFKSGTQNRLSQMALAVKRISKPLTKKESKKSVEGSNSRLNHIQDLSTAPISFVKSPSVQSNVGDAEVVETKH